MFLASDEYSPNYYIMLQRITAYRKLAPWSFVSHCMGFERGHMLSVHDMIERKTSANWIDGVLNNLNTSVSDSFSEYELYGNYIYNTQRDFIIRYWYNQKVKESLILSEESPPFPVSRYTTISCHDKRR